MRSKHVLTNLVIMVFLCGNLLGSVTPNPLISIGKTVYASPDTDKELLVNGIWNDGWGNNWVSNSGSWLAIEVGNGPDKVMLNFNNFHYSWCNTILGFCNDLDPDYIGEYRILTSSNSTNGEDGDWDEEVHVTGNTFSARTHSFDFTGKSWVKMEIVSAHASGEFTQYGLEYPSIGEIEIFDISDSKDDSWFFIGNSITAGAFKGLGYFAGEIFEEIIYTESSETFRPMVLRGGIPCIHSYEVADALDQYYNAGGSDAKYWAILLGTNDASGGSNSGVANYISSMQTIIDYALDHDKIPILAQIPATNESDAGWQVHPDYLTAIEDLIADNDILAGPDFYNWFISHQSEINDGVHMTEDGYKSMQRLWAEFALDYVYSDNIPVVPKITSFSIDPSTASSETETEITITATVTDESASVSVTLDLSAIGGGSEVVMTKAGDDYSLTYTVEDGLATGSKQIIINAINAEDNSRSKSFELKIIGPAGEELIIYNDAETEITYVWVSNGGSISEVTGGAYEGSKHYENNYNAYAGGWCVTGLDLNTVDISSYAYLQLACKMEGAESVSMKLYDGLADDPSSVGLSTYGLNDSYQHLFIPLSDFDAALDMSFINKISFTMYGGTGSGTFSIDDIKAINSLPAASQISNFLVSPATINDNTTTELGFSVTIIPAAGSTVQSVTLDLSSIGGSSSYAMTASGNIYSASYTAASGLSEGIKTISLNLDTDQVDETKIVQITVVNVKLIPANALIIYNDNETLIVTHWENSFTLTEISNGQAYEGTKNWRFECAITAGWANFAFNMNNWTDPGIDFSVYDSIQFACRYSGASTVSIGLHPQGGDVVSVELDGISSGYQVFTIALDEFTGLDLEDIYEIQFNFWGVNSEDGVFDIDDIRLIPASSGLGTPELSVPQSTVTINWQEGSAAYFDIEANVSWNVSTDASWLSIVNSQGSGNSSVAVVAQENTTNNTRSAVILIEGTDVDDVTITAIQSYEGMVSINSTSNLEVEIYPNPASSEFQIQSSMPVNVTIFNFQGIIVKSEQNIHEKAIDISYIQNGLYFIKVESGEKMKIIKLIKH